MTSFSIFNEVSYIALIKLISDLNIMGTNFNK